MILLFSTEEALVTIRFDLTSFPDKIYQWREHWSAAISTTPRLLRNGHPRFLKSSN